ncbi:S53 family peptidase [Branchiibius sp. NY16-3462-2]|uniref:S53 family peptidase n=1 Tax=Branchiibius sp. NY16-3462-2 TaxID=1807500 RepID=UPI0025C5B0CB|nr:S53 family peptidase [Branchiibius sp. NY16-3462-2]
MAAVTVTLALSVAGAAAANASVTADGSIKYPGSVPKWAVTAQDAGAAPADDTVEGEIYLNLQDKQGAETLATAVSTPGSPLYRHPLSPSQWISRFSPTAGEYATVVNKLKSEGLTITGTPASRLYVVFRGTADQVNAAFSTSMHLYHHAGTRLAAPAKAPALPSSIAKLVSAVSLDQSRLQTRPNLVSPGHVDKTAGSSSLNKSKAQAQSKLRSQTTPSTTAACSQYWGQYTASVPAAYNGQTSYPTNICGYDAKQLRSGYNLNTWNSLGVNGSGQTVAITDAYASPTIVSDTNALAAQSGEPALGAGQYQQIVPSTFYDEEACGGPSGWQGEQSLDVQAVHSLAPKTNILYVGGSNCGGGLDIALSTIIDRKLATVVSNSWGDVGEDVPAEVLAGEQNIFVQAAGEGIGLYFSSGDNGDEAAALGTAEPDFPASDPFVTSVGGTSMGIDKKGKLAVETGWGTAYQRILDNADGTSSYAGALPGAFGGGAGGGVSTLFAEPAYQKGVVPNSLSGGKRVSPDVSALADPYTGFQIGISPITDDGTLATADYENETYGGTSLASPLTAAMVALSQQLTHGSVGFANPTLYTLDRFLPGSFRDVKPSSTPVAVEYTSASSGHRFLITMDKDTSLTTTAGYDDVTGMGAMSFSLAQLLGHGR